MQIYGTKARRHLVCLWPSPMRRALRMVRLWPMIAFGIGFGSIQTQAGSSDLGDWFPETQTITGASFQLPTTRYAHGVLGDAIEWGGLSISFEGPEGKTSGKTIELPLDHVFEDIEPRLVDLNLDGRLDAVMVVETDMALGAALALYGPGGKIDETPHIGRSNRWLAPVGAADLDGDGRIEIAYVDRPHLAKTLRIWRFENRQLTEIAQITGLTNHRIGDDFISGGIKQCGAVPEMVLASSDWRRIQSVTFDQGWNVTDVGQLRRISDLAAPLSCD
jgi:FG-GAP-like repeat